MYAQSHHANQSPTQSSPVQAPQGSSSRSLQQFNDLMKESACSGANLVPIKESSRVQKQEVSMLVKLQHSLGQRPSFQQLFHMEQEKKHLWELLALKEQNLQKLQAKLKQQQAKNNQITNQLSKKDQVINKLKQKELKSKQRQLNLQNELKKVISIKNNIIQEFNFIKKLHAQQEWQRENAHITHLNGINQHSNELKIPSTLVPQINTQSLQHQAQNSVGTLKQQIAKLTRENSALTQTNIQLKTSLDQLLAELRSIKLDLLQNFHLTKPTHNISFDHPFVHTHYSSKENIIIDNGVKIKAINPNQKQLSLNKFSQNPQNKSQYMPKHLQNVQTNLHPNVKLVRDSLAKSKQAQENQFQTKIPKEKFQLKQKDFLQNKRNSLSRLPLNNQTNKNVSQTSNRTSLGRKDKHCLRQLPIR